MLEDTPFTVVETSAGVTFPEGFEASGVACDIRCTGKERLDLAVIHSKTPCSHAAVFTRNRIFAAPVKYSRGVLGGGLRVHAIVANSGNANACTGPQGWDDAREMAALTGSSLGCDPHAVYVCSTGRIGRALPMERIRTGIGKAAGTLSDSVQAGQDAANAILTSDTREKVVAVEIRTPEGVIRVGGIAKGAGMIQPDMATMLAFITTDARIDSAKLQSLLHPAVKRSFNSITVDGDMSTNDTVIVLANGASNVVVSSEIEDAFVAALNHVCEALARKIVGDGEKITKVVELKVSGAASDQDAELIARAIGNSLLVKSSWYGNDPNWGRLLDAAGYSGAEIIEDRLELFYQSLEEGSEPIPVFLRGLAVDENLSRWKSIVLAKNFVIDLRLHLGKGVSRIFASDLTEGYVNFNKSE